MQLEKKNLKYAKLPNCDRRRNKSVFLKALVLRKWSGKKL